MKNKDIFYNFLIKDIKNSWKSFFEQEYKKEYFDKIIEELFLLYNNNREKVLPVWENIFRIFKIIELLEIKVIILGQDPYYIDNMADGIAFSTKLDRIPKSLSNIYTELVNDLKLDRRPTTGNLEKWVKEGVFLINTSLTVLKNKPLSHSLLWEDFTKNLLDFIINSNKDIVLVLWGKKAKKYIDKFHLLNSKNIISSSHPSPFSVNISFFNSRPFSNINELLEKNNKTIINWNVLD